MRSLVSTKQRASDLTISPLFLKEWLREVLSKAGLHISDATVVAENLVHAESRGVFSHGLILLAVYVDRIRHGGIRAAYRPSVLLDAGSVLILDGDGGPGQSLATYAVRLANERAQVNGLSFVTLRNSNHVGMLASYGLLIADAGMVGIIMTNSGPSVNVFRGVGSRIGNNALCVAVPSKPEPVIFDMATGTVACGKVRAAANSGTRLPQGWIQDKYGNPSQNPLDLDEGGSMTPLGGYKGYGLAVMIDILTGLISGGVSSLAVAKQRVDTAVPTRASQSFIVLNLERFVGKERLMQQTQNYITQLRQSLPANTELPVIAPGDPELHATRQSAKLGIALPNSTLHEINKVASSLGVASLSQ